MIDEGENIIEEYLLLVREKLPKSIADDVINELRSYMQESAREQGDGEITVQSAKKIVAQFGAPGEVADEYKYSMLPETIPDDIVPKVIIGEPQSATLSEPMVKTQEQLTPIAGEDPTMTYPSVLAKAIVQSCFWIFIVSLMTFLMGPIGFPPWTLIVPISQAVIVICGLTLYTMNLKRNKTILWRRAYKEWSAIQNYVTFPENSIPEAGPNVLKLDIFIASIGIALFGVVTFLGSSAFFPFMCGLPVVMLLSARSYYSAIKFKDDKDPIRNSRKQFIINLVLLAALDAVIFWITMGPYYGSILLNLSPSIVPFIIGYGSIVLFDIVTGTQNLWWKAEKQAETISTREKSVTQLSKTQLLANLSRNTAKLYARVSVCIFVYNLPIIITSVDPATYGFIYSDYPFWIYSLVFVIISTGGMLAAYFLYRRFMISRLDSHRVFGQRTRIEAGIDAIASLFFIGVGFMLLPAYTLHQYTANDLIFYQRHLGIRWGAIFEVMQIIIVPIALVGLIFRIFGNLLEFRPIWKRKATGLIEQSSVLLVIAITIFMTTQYIQWTAIYNWYSSFAISYVSFLPIVIFLAFQIGSSALKRNSSIENGHNSKGKSVKSNNVYSSIAN